jgi:hypothetical protein
MSRFPFAEITRELREPVGIDLGALRKVKPAELAIRFAFGAGIALIAGVVGIRFGPRVGGLFLAFPAVLPASLTLLEKKDGRDKADVDALGAVLGSCGLVAFAVAMVVGLPLLGAVPAMAVAGVVWVAVAVSLFLRLRAMRIS